MTDFKVGDKVAIRGVGMNRSGLEVRKVARVLKRFVELDNGRKFTPEGRVYPHQRFSVTSLALLTPELEAEARRQNFVRLLSKTEWDSLDNETLAKVASLVRS